MCVGSDRCLCECIHKSGIRLSLPKIKSVRIDGAAHQGQDALRYARRAERAVEPAHPCLMRDAFGRRCVLHVRHEDVAQVLLAYHDMVEAFPAD
jgi:hypothetical protein